MARHAEGNGSRVGPQALALTLGSLRVTMPKQILVRKAREKLDLTQAAFAERIDTPVALCATGSRAGSRRLVPWPASCG